MNKEKQALFGVITGYSWNDVAPFFRSYESNRWKESECVIWHGLLSGECVKNISNIPSVKIIQIDENRRGEFCNDYRWRIYHDYLCQNRHKYSHIVTLDIRDTILQGNILQ